MKKLTKKKTAKRTIAGIDLSLTSPAICIHEGDVFNFNTCKFYFLSYNRKFANYSSEKLSGHLIDHYNSEEQRYDLISGWIINVLLQNKVSTVFLENYAYAATGRVFNIAENGGVVKHKIWYNKIPMFCIPPTQVKKFATGKGNSNKLQMQVAFIEETNYNVKNELGLSENVWNPSSDIIDSYYICKYGFNLPMAQLDSATAF